MQSHHRPDQMLEKYQELIETALQRKSQFKPTSLPIHLSNKSEMLRSYIKKTAFNGKDSTLLDWIRF